MNRYKSYLLKFRLVRFIVPLLVGVLLIIVVGRSLNPFDNTMFLGHDETQSARIMQFTENLKNWKFPPRIAPDFSFGMGYPVFNYYAPFAYWITSFIHLITGDVIGSLKISYLMALAVAYVGMTLFLKRFFSLGAALAGAVCYAVSPYIAVEILVRANLAEMWFIALLPVALYLILSNTPHRMGVTVFGISALITAHNILSIIALGILFIWVLMSKNRKLNLLALGLSLLATASFYIPLIIEMKYIHGASVAGLTKYVDHFVCIGQLWSSPWGYGGSAPGCTADGFSFMLGKIQIILGVGGAILLLSHQFLKSNTRFSRFSVFIFILTLSSILLTLTASTSLWKVFEKYASLIQFPWRFLVFSLFGLSFFSSYLLDYFPRSRLVLGIIVSVALILLSAKFFTGQFISKSQFVDQYASQYYIRNVAAYKIAEYLPKTASYSAWRSLEGNKYSLLGSVVENTGNATLRKESIFPFRMSFEARSNKPILINIHSAPHWNITKNGKKIIPQTFDSLGRPQVIVSSKIFDKIEIKYSETWTERIANLITLIAWLTLILYTAYHLFPRFRLTWIRIIRR